jgi:DNA replication protein DnaC
MKDIGKIKSRLEHIYPKRYCNCNGIDQCPTPDKCQCKILSEIMAYIYAIIPDPYYKFTIHDFNGLKQDVRKQKYERILNTNIAIEARKKIIEYCWKDLPIDKIDIEDNIDSYSSIDRRRRDGTNVVIYGSEEYDFKEKKQQKGRTMIAALIMKEAIRRRVEPKNQVQTYDWISFPILESYLKNNSYYDMSIANLKTCDWLCIDDISKKNDSSAAKAFRTSLLDPFLLERLDDGLPTILVFRFDINDVDINWEESFGIAINRIIHDSKTYLISLCEKE